MSRGQPSGRRSRPQALRRHRAAALIALGAVAATTAAAPASPKPKPPPPKPRITLLTGTEQGALRREAIKVEVDSSRGEEARVKANFVVDGYPEDFFFRLGPETEKLRNGKAMIRLGLSARQREVLDFAIKSCRGATLDIATKVGRGSASLDASLRRPQEC